MLEHRINTLIEDYKKEYARVNGTTPQVTRTSSKSTWIEINHNFYRSGDVRKMLEALKARGSNPQYTHAEGVAQGCFCGC